MTTRGVRNTKTAGRACHGKTRYTSRHNADNALWHLIRQGANPAAVTAYKCPHGDHWHVGHRVGNRRKR